MNLKGLVKKARAALDAEDGLTAPCWRPPFDMDAERERWADTLGHLEAVLGAELAVPVCDHVARQWAEFQTAVDYYAHAPDVPRPSRFIARRYPALIRRFAELVPADLRPVVFNVSSVNGNATTQSPWVGWWLSELTRGHTRLPADLSPETMGRLLVVYIARGYRDAGHGFKVCIGCGLRRPDRFVSPPDLAAGVKGEYFAACPHCQEPAWEWWTLIEKRHLPWMDRIDAECGL